MIEFLSFVLFIFIFIFLLMSTVKVRLDNFHLAKINLQLAIEKTELGRMLEDSLAKNIETPISQSEGFVNFISQSRDWAFDYIETVQVGLDKFIKDAGPAIEYFDKYGNAMHTPLTDGMAKISEAYKDLKTLIPDDYGKLDR
jgi:hypothetical protein